MHESTLRRTLSSFGAVGLFLGGADGYLIGAATVPVLVGALVGAFIGTGLALLGWQPRPQDEAPAGPAARHGKQPNYVLIWAILFVLTIVEVSVAFLALAKVQIIIALVVLAVWKALLVALYYMHLKFEPRRMWLLAASPLPLAMILVLAVLTEGW
ncbi:MAG TPA: cytochrome C oxidase subunit IV family protein [Longimicrobiales bacterium]